MGTRADFYLGRGEAAEWLGSVAWDGYPEGFDDDLWRVTDESTFRSCVARLLSDRDDGTTPELGWPWPWETSDTTDYAYSFDAGTVYGSCFGSPWFEASNPPEDYESLQGPGPDFPDMSARKAVTFGRRSGVIVIGAPAKEDS